MRERGQLPLTDAVYLRFACFTRCFERWKTECELTAHLRSWSWNRSNQYNEGTVFYNHSCHPRYATALYLSLNITQCNTEGHCSSNRSPTHSLALSHGLLLFVALIAPQLQRRIPLNLEPNVPRADRLSHKSALNKQSSDDSSGREMNGPL